MFQRRPKRFRRRSNDRAGNGHAQSRMRLNTFSNGHNRSKFRPSQSAEKLFEKYTAMAKEAMSSGDKTLSENYLQHADHFMRIIEDKNKNRDQNKDNIFNKTTVDNKPSPEDSKVKQEDAIKNKE